MSSGQPPPKKRRTTFQQAGRAVKAALRIPPSQPLPPNPVGPFSQPTPNQPSGSATRPAQSSTAPLRGVKRAARAAWSTLENALRTLEQSSDMFPPVKPAINGLLAGIDFLEASLQLPCTFTSADVFPT
ncbi:hypothetical protein FS749_016787 [Ceratobasidium sp. UAMH 11750]|nr:hypothetical protein FS749_016787 [Ceratobasidium sp. UAMH 11750]